MTRSKAKSKRGRKEKYETHIKPCFDVITGYLRAGYTEKGICKAIGIHTSTWCKSKIKYVEFCELIKKAKEDSNALVVNKLFQRAVGYEYEEVHTEIRQQGQTQQPGQQAQGETVLIRKIKKHMAADVGAAIFWLCNRQPERWRNAKYEEMNTDETKKTKITPDQEARLMDVLTAPGEEDTNV